MVYDQNTFLDGHPIFVVANFDEFCIPLRRYEENQFLLQTNHSIRFLRGKKSNNIDIVLALESKQTLTHRCRKIGYSGNWCFFFKSISRLMLLFHGYPNFQTHLSPSSGRPRHHNFAASSGANFPGVGTSPPNPASGHVATVATPE